MRRLVLFLAVAVAVAAAGAGGIAVLGDADRSSSTQDRTAAERTRARATAAVARRDLVQTEDLSGALGYGDPVPIAAAGAGTLTGLPAGGTVVRRGEALWEVDGRDVPLLHGPRPMWRPLGEGDPDGEDVRQLERQLRDLGFDQRERMRIDRRFDAATTAAVRRWQRSREVAETGRVELGDAVFVPGDVRVAARSLAVGEALASGAPVLEVTGLARIVTADVAPGRAAELPPGEAVDVELADGTTVDGAVYAVSPVASMGGGERSGTEGAAGGGGGAGGSAQAPTVQVTFALVGDPGTAIDRSPVTVRVTGEERRGVLTVPVTALLALAEGGYAVEVPGADGPRLVAVETGMFAGPFVEVSGADVTEGMRVVVPT